MLTIDEIKKVVAEIAPKYQITKVTLFGSRARGNNREDSDIDLIVEFDKEKIVTLFTIANLMNCLEDIFGVSVDVIYSPLPKDSTLEIDKEVEIYAA